MSEKHIIGKSPINKHHILVRVRLLNVELVEGLAKVAPISSEGDADGEGMTISVDDIEVFLPEPPKSAVSILTATALAV